MVGKNEPAQWGHEALEMIRRDYYLAKSKLYAEHPDRKQPAFNWGVGVLLSALNAAAKHEPKYKPWLKEYADASHVYWNKGGYDVLPAPKPLDRYYDDNAWMVLALVETHQILGDAKYLRWAKEALDFALSGEAKDGGIFWRESDKASRNTCSNAPTAAACLAVYAVTKEPKLKTKAEQLYNWTKAQLQDPQDSLYWDSLSNSDKIDKTKWTYNSALMIRTAFLLGDRADDVKKLNDSASSRWLRDNKIGDAGRFAHLLMEAWIESAHSFDAHAILAKVHGAKNLKGHFPSHWGELKVSANPEILDQASFARACFVVANQNR